MVKYVVIVEGGGNCRADQAPLRQSFIRLRDKLGLENPPQILCAGGRGEGCRDFKKAHARSAPALLLVDSEECLSGGVKPWEHVKHREGDKWDKPAGATDDDLHFMAPTMEAWLVADPSALATHYGQGFKEERLPKRIDLEQESKVDLVSKLQAATKDTSKKAYEKNHGFVLLGKVDPAVLRKRCPYAHRFFTALESRSTVAARDVSVTHP